VAGGDDIVPRLELPAQLVLRRVGAPGSTISMSVTRLCATATDTEARVTRAEDVIAPAARTP
jgi:hypothetical protein